MRADGGERLLESFYSFLQDFALFMLIWIAPWVAIYLTDFLLRRGRHDSGALMQTAKGLYYRHDGIHWPGVMAQLLGMAVAASWLNAYPAWIAPLSSHPAGPTPECSWARSSGAGLYYLLNRRSVRAEAEASTHESDGSWLDSYA